MNRNEAINAIWTAVVPRSFIDAGATPEAAPHFLGNIDAPVESDLDAFNALAEETHTRQAGQRRDATTNVPTCPHWCVHHENRTEHPIEGEQAGFFRVEHSRPADPDAHVSVTAIETASYDTPDLFLPAVEEPPSVFVNSDIIGGFGAFITRDAARKLASALTEAVRILDEHEDRNSAP